MVAVLTGVALLSGRSVAATRDGALRVEVITAYNLVVDSNAGTPSSYAPRSAYIGVAFHNDGTNDLTDVFAYIGNYNGGSGPTPGIYPARAHPGLTGPLDGGAFAFTHEGGTAGLADATRYIPTIPAGDSITVYWLIGYDQLDINKIPLWGSSVKPDDDLWLEYDVWATASEGATPRAVDLTRTMHFRNEISASANKIFPNGANKVPQYYKDLLAQYEPAWTNSNHDGTVGTRIVTEGIWYDLGNVGAGFDNDGDLVPDRNAWMQPVGDPTLYDAGAFRLVKTYAMVVVKLISGGELVLTGEDQLYFEHIPDNNGAVGYVRYEFMPLKANARSVTTPYQEVASGYDNEKFNADYGVALGNGLVSGKALVTLDKNASVATVPAGGSIAYTVAYTNGGEVAAGNPELGLPLVVQDSIPDGTVYQAGSATAANTLPAGVGGYTVFYSIDGGLTWSLTEPAAALVTDLQWWLDDALPAGAAGVIRFSVTVDDPYLEPSPVILNVAGVSFGNTEPFATDDATTLVLGVNSVGDTIFADTGVGAGGYLGNGLQDGSEPGLAGIPVHLYRDANANGIADGGETLLASSESDANGSYLFEDLPDGRYVVVVDFRDNDVPAGYTVTTPSAHGVDLDDARADANPVSVLTADFGFAPALVQTKERVGTGNLLEGHLVTYLIPVTNRLAGTGEATPQPARYTVWPTTGTTDSNANKQWTDYANAWSPGEPDGAYATAPFQNAQEWIRLDGYAYGAQVGAITNVTLLIPMVINGTFLDNSDLTITVESGATTIYTGVHVANTLVGGMLAIDITSAQTTWTWGHFNGTTLAVRLVANKASKPEATLGIDSVGFRLTTDALVGGGDDTTLDPLPLLDTYDPARLQYVSSDPAADSAVTNSGVGEIRWDNLGPIYAGGGRLVAVTFKVLEPSGNVSAPVTNTACITNAWFANGLRANETWATNIASVLPAGTIGDFVWRDLNDDGVQDPGEPGVANVTVTITPPAGVNLGFGAGVASNAVTDANGYYLFEGLPASGSYTVAVVASTLPGGSGTPTWDYDGVGTANQAVIPLVVDSTTGADTVLEADFGYTLQATIRGTIWHDLDWSGTATPDAGEDLLAGITVDLRTNGVVIATDTTDAQGAFLFVGDFSGDYTVTVATDSGPLAAGAWSGTFDSDGLATASVVSMNVPSGGLGLADFSYALAGTLAIGDTLFYDWNGNGMQDPGTDGGVDAVEVFLYQDDDGDGVVDAGVDAFVAATVSATNGLYRFEDLPPGTYQVVVNRSSANLHASTVVTADPYGALDGVGVVTLTANDNLDQDFGFHPGGPNSLGDTVWYDSNGDGTQLGAMETGIAGVTVWLYADLDADGSYFLVRTAVTDEDGHYLFSSLPDGAYRVVVDDASSALPTDAFGNPCRPTTPTSFDVALSGGSYLDADFGFVLPGAIGDTIWWDYNGNADQDWTEPGIPGVTVRLYRDANANGVYDSGETLVAIETTNADGKYIFHNLTPDRYVVVVDPASPPLAGATLTGDPNNDGEPCPIPAIPGPSCDAQYGVLLVEESTFRGADFGYQPPGSIGDTVWLDLNTNGARDASELGIPYVTVELLTNGVVVATTTTDPDGYYSFGGLADGTYAVRVVATNAIFASVTQSYDPDGALDHVGSGVVIADGHVSEIGGVAVTDADLDIDLGYRYGGDNSLSGTVGLDAPVFDGLLNGTIPSGVAAGEYPFAGVAVYLLLWNDDGDDLVDPGETTQMQATATAANGDYMFAGLPAGDGNDRYIVALGAPATGLRLTTETLDTPALWVSNTTNHLGHSVSSYQVVAIDDEVVNIDFAYEAVVERDFGDLPLTYSTMVSDRPVGPSHATVAGQQLWLGAGLDVEANGQPTPDASGDGDDEDGVVVKGRWTDGGNSGHVEVTVGAGSGWLVGWIDFNQDGAFTNANEMVISQAVDSQGTGVVYALSFPIPAGTFRTDAVTVLNARFRLYPAQPLIPLFAGEVTGGEVEDYQWVFGALGDRTWFDANKNGLQDAGEPALTNVTVQLYDAGNVLLGTALSDDEGRYLFTGLTTGVYYMVFSVSTNFYPTVPQAGDSSLDSDPATNGVTALIAMTTATFDTSVDAGFREPVPLSSGIDLRAYGTAEGVYVEFVAYDVANEGFIRLALLGADGKPVWTGSIAVAPAERLVCRFLVPGLVVGGTYDFAIRDEEGKGWSAPGVLVTPFAAEMVRMSLTGVTLAFNSLPEREYEIQWTGRLGSQWRTVTNVPSQGERTSVLVVHPDPASPSGFFRVRMK